MLDIAHDFWPLLLVNCNQSSRARPCNQLFKAPGDHYNLSPCKDVHDLGTAISISDLKGRQSVQVYVPSKQPTKGIDVNIPTLCLTMILVNAIGGLNYHRRTTRQISPRCTSGETCCCNAAHGRLMVEHAAAHPWHVFFRGIGAPPRFTDCFLIHAEKCAQKCCWTRAWQWGFLPANLQLIPLIIELLFH